MIDDFAIGTIFIIWLLGMISYIILEAIIFDWFPKMKKLFYKIKDFFDTLRRKYDDFAFKYIRVPKYWRQLKKRYKNVNQNEYDNPYVPWDVTDTSVDLLFASFVHFFENYKDKFFPVDDALQPYYDEMNRWQGKQSKDWLKHIKERKTVYEDAYKIYKYITVVRIANMQLLDALTEEMFQDFKFNFVDIPGELHLQEIKDNGKDKRFNLEFHFSDFHHVIIDKKTLTNNPRDLSIHNLEQAMYEKDSELAKRIIEIRGYMWD